MSNKSNGSRFERRIAQILSKNGFWVHLLAQNASGQPADIIAVKNGKAYLIDCKLCEGNYFDLRRVELNQELSMTKWRECKNGEGLFCISSVSYTHLRAHETSLHLVCRLLLEKKKKKKK